MNTIKREITARRKAKRSHQENTAMAMEACRGCKAVIGYVKRFRPEVRRRILAAAAVLCA